jgi:hypothetical protein
MKYSITYTVPGNEIEISKKVESESMDDACRKAKDSVMWPLEFEKQYREMQISVHEENSGIGSTFPAYSEEE